MSDIAVARALEAPVMRAGLELLALPEDQWFDRKSIRISASTLANFEVGFANAEGGTLVVGLAGGRVEGIDADRRKVNDLRQASVNFTQPPVPARCREVPCVNAHGSPDHLLVVEVEASPMVHANQRDEVFLRVGDENRRLSFAQRQELTFDKGQAAFDSTPLSHASLSDLDAPLLAQYAQALGHPDPERLLTARGIAKPNGIMTVAAILLFGVQPQAHFPEAYVRVIRYLGRERGSGSRHNVTFDERCEGPIPLALEHATELVQRLAPARQALGRVGRFEAAGLIPRDAWLEGLVNAVIHRSYSLGGDHVRAEIFDDRIEIESPGRFPGLVDPDRPETLTRFARNPHVARVCADLRIGQELGEGIRRMYDEMRNAGLEPPLFHQTQASVRLTLSATPLDPSLEAKLPPGSRKTLDTIRAAGRLGTGELAELFGVSRPTMLARLRALEQAGLIRWVGKSAKDPRAHWALQYSK